MSGVILVKQKETGKIIDVPEGHWTLNPAEWPSGHDSTGRPVFAEEYERVENPEDYEFDMGESTLDPMGNPRTTRLGKGWVLKSPKASRSRSTRTKNENASSAAP